MANPTEYSRAYSFSGFQANNPQTPLPGPNVDEELDNLGLSVNQTIAGLKDIRRADGALRNGIVTVEAMAPGIITGLNPATEWQAGKQYFVNDTVFYQVAFYRCLESHVSNADFTVDLAASRWEKYADLAPIVTEAEIARDQAVAAKDTAVAAAGTATSAASAASTDASTASGAATSAAASATSAAASYDLFDDRYLGEKTTLPTLDNDGNALVNGALVSLTGQVDPQNDGMYVRRAGAWQKMFAATNVLLNYARFSAGDGNLTAGQTTFVISGGYIAGYADVYRNGLKLVNGVDVTITSGTQIVLAAGVGGTDTIEFEGYRVLDSGLFADQATAEAGTSATTLMSPLRVKQAIAATTTLGDGNIATPVTEAGGILDTKVARRHSLISGPAIIRSFQSYMDQGLTLAECSTGPLGYGQDATTALQKLASECANLGFIGKIGPGDFPVTSSIIFDEAGAEGIAVPRGGLRGEGPSGTRIRPATGVTPLVIRGGTPVPPDTVGLVYNAKFSDFMLLQVDGTGTGINVDNFAWGLFDNLFVTGFAIGLNATDFLSSTVSHSRIRGNTRGIVSMFSDFSRPNALTFLDINLGANVEYGAFFQEGTTLDWIGGAVEGNGWTGTGGFGFQGGIYLLNGGSEGAVGASFRSVYFEYNKGSADLKISHTANDAAYEISGCSFNRIDSTKYVTNNLYVENGGPGQVVVNLLGCGFKGYNTYVESAARPYLSVTGAELVSHPGCMYKSDTAYIDPAKWGSAVRGGAVAADGSALKLPRAWASVKSSTGVYTITHNLGTTDYGVVATADTVNSNHVERIIRGTNVFTVVVSSPSNVLTDDAFSFVLKREY